MLSLFDSVFNTAAQTSRDVWMFLLCIAVSLVVGGLYCLAFSLKKTGESGSFRCALFFLPAVVCVTILMVNGNIGVGIAVAGAFSLVRFRSAQGTAKEIAALFTAMCSGLIVGVGFLAYSVLFSVIMCALLVLWNFLSAMKTERDRTRILQMTVPEDLNYPHAFDDIFADCTDACRLVRVKTTGMGSLFRLTYEVKLKEGADEKGMIDRLRERNGNMEILLTWQRDAEAAL